MIKDRPVEECSDWLRNIYECELHFLHQEMTFVIPHLERRDPDKTLRPIRLSFATLDQARKALAALYQLPVGLHFRDEQKRLITSLDDPRCARPIEVCCESQVEFVFYDDRCAMTWSFPSSLTIKDVRKFSPLLDDSLLSFRHWVLPDTVELGQLNPRSLNCRIDLYPGTADVVMLKIEAEEKVFDLEFLASAVLRDVWNALKICGCKNMVACEWHMFETSEGMQFSQYDCLEDIRDNVTGTRLRLLETARVYRLEPESDFMVGEPLEGIDNSLSKICRANFCGHSRSEHRLMFETVLRIYRG
jgi:hypothetical protein